MSYQYAFHELAQKDYENAILWYLEKSEKATMGFIDAVDNALLKICHYPVRYRNPYRQFYEIGLQKYPYIVIYTLEEEENKVIIWKLFHHKQNPKKKYSGLKRIGGSPLS